MRLDMLGLGYLSLRKFMDFTLLGGQFRPTYSETEYSPSCSTSTHLPTSESVAGGRSNRSVDFRLFAGSVWGPPGLVPS